MLDKDKIVGIIKIKGPILPVQLGKEIGGNSMLAGAILSELVKSRHIKISNAKVGGSPVYYAPGQEPKLSLLYDHLHEKEKKAYDLLKEHKVLRDQVLQPVERVALREIKDFASPIEVNLPSGRELFWRWYLTSNNEAEVIIKQMLGIGPDEKKAEEQKKEEPENGPTDEKKHATDAESKVEAKSEIEADHEIEQEPKIKKAEPFVQEPKPQTQKIDRKPTEEISKKVEKQDFLKPDTPDDDFLDKIKSDFNDKGIKIKEISIIRKNSEIDLILKIPSAIGDVQFFCKARNKKKSNDGDLSTTFLQGQLKKMPTIYLTTGEMTKKAIDMLDREFKGLLVIKL